MLGLRWLLQIVRTLPLWPLKRLRLVAVIVSQRPIVLSPEAVIKR